MTFRSTNELSRTASQEYELVIDDLVKQREPVETVAREPGEENEHYSKRLGPLLFEHLCEVANTTSALISPLVGTDYCTVTIKLLWLKGTAVVVHTLLRDARSYRQRGSYLPTDNFQVGDNTAFETLVSSNEGLYLANNLRLDAADGKYLNANSRWREFYNSTAVVRIDRPSGNGIIGFLCADAWSWNATAKREPTGDVLRKIAQHVYNTLELIVPEGADGRKNIGFAHDARGISPINRAFQLKFQSILESFHKTFDEHFCHREARDESRLPGANDLGLPTLNEESGMPTSKDIEAMRAAVARTGRVKRLRSRLNAMSHQEIADRLKPIARHNRYAKDLLAHARKKGLVK